MPNIRFCTINAVDLATLSLASTSEVASFPLANVKKTPRDTVFRSQDLSTQVIRGTWNGDGFLPGMFGMFGHNAHGGSVRLELFSGADWTGSVYDSGTLPVTGVVAIDGFSWGIDPLGISGSDLFVLESPYIDWFTPQICSSFQITLSGSGGGGREYWEVNRFWLAAHLEATINPAFGANLFVQDNTESRRMRGGTLRSDVGSRWRRFEFELAWMLEAQRPLFLDMMKKVQRGRDVVVSMFPDAGGRAERDYTINGKMVTLDPINYANFAYRSKKFVIEEL